MTAYHRRVCLAHTKMRIRAAVPDDIPLIVELDRGSPTSAHWTVERYIDALAVKTPSRFLIVTDPASDSLPTQAVVAFLVAIQIGPEWELENIVVAPTVQRKGVGNRLLQALLAEAAKASNASVFLEVRESNLAARGLYEKAGFQITGRRKSYYANPLEDAILYRWQSKIKRSQGDTGKLW